MPWGLFQTNGIKGKILLKSVTGRQVHYPEWMDINHYLLSTNIFLNVRKYFACMYVCMRVWDTLEQELQTVLSCHVGTKAGSSARATNALTPEPSLHPLLSFFAFLSDNFLQNCIDINRHVSIQTRLYCLFLYYELWQAFPDTHCVCIYLKHLQSQKLRQENHYKFLGHPGR